MVSICIPTYKKPEFVKRLLDSIQSQTVKDIEVIISDDSPTNEIGDLANKYKDVMNLKYIHHSPALKSPKNWNFALSAGSGEYLMLIHQDDWLASITSIESYLKVFENNNNIDFVYSKNTALTQDGRIVTLQGLKYLMTNLEKFPYRLVIADVIGPPSNVMIRREIHEKIQYDENFIWLVDVDYYVRLLKANLNYKYIDNHLITIGLHKDQTTEYCQKNPHIMIKENIWFAKKIEKFIFGDIISYDYFWRLIRNYRIDSIEKLCSNNLMLTEIPAFIKSIISFQKYLPYKFLKIGLFSKLFMFISYVTGLLRGV